MTKLKILQDNQSYTFRSYFELPYEADDILAEFDYTLIKSHLSLPQTTQPLNQLPELKQRIEDILPFISLSNETARRETLVSPILLEVIRYCQCQMRIEYPLSINNRLKGNLDYLLRLKNNLLVIEAKNDDLTRGFTQLAIELIALSHIEEKTTLYGAVTIGNIWQFGKIDSSQQQITQDINLFKVPGDLDNLVAVIVGILEGV
ncbi:hypothetical protein IQ226_04035 [Dolichospermum sp. LEGE 00240]|jgi:hypothetical protein|uniref:hypothetical protein n=1 Tax=Dolichospermum sp. LEGE 00240 TaxID=1828603 RepID=UPI00187E2B07|nr:hypothetical protein [Dolichospermum sp. LEGE 00240]MDM3846663.1 hypothetical protein [Aphanizomenon gracile PMC638.10]MDM3849766.1 hypothetical protein [Aphanizomenon gracile PMC627.10]MDM3853398.1 hypothetical protein [Aphanizomenon gracile PMC649.10]MDM3860528.1 hypothetical protein [Aphanizomenon gracile PMC644.10]MBE9248378.1 hypothetical protein [Dolichospermum sp. LEGE 00240]